MNQELGALTIPASESDDKVREAEIFIYKTELSGFAGTVAQFALTPALIEARAKHWQLVFKFKDGTWVKIDGDKSGWQLKGRYVKDKTPPIGVQWSLKDAFTVLPTQLGGLHVKKTNVSPKQLHKIAQSHPLNDTRYDLVFNNCQNWAIEGCRMLHICTREVILEWAKAHYKENFTRDFCVLCLHPKSICPFRGDHSLEDDYPFQPYTTDLGYNQ